MMKPEHTPITDAELENIDPYMDWTGASMIVRMMDDLRESRRLLRAVEQWHGSLALPGHVLRELQAYLAACEGKEAGTR